MSISRRETGYRELDFRAAVALGAGMTGEEAAQFASCDRTTIYERRKHNREFMDLVEATVKAATAMQIANMGEKLKSKYQAMYEKAVSNLSEFLDEDDPRIRFAATTRVIDQMEGKPTQRIETKHQERVEVEHTVSLPPELSRFLLSAIGNTQRVLTGGAPEEIPDAEVIDDFAPRASAEGSERALTGGIEDSELQPEGI